MTARIAFVIFAVAIVALCGLRRASAAEKAATSRAAATTRPAIPVGKDTTRLLRPLGPDGRVDYVAALNEKYGKGVTPENNAAVKLIEVFGADALLPSSIREEVLRRLGMTEAEKSMHSQWVSAAQAKLSDSLNLASKGVWREEDYPELAKWLKRNEDPLAKLVEASNRPRYCMPLVALSDRPMFSMSFPTLKSYRDGTKALIARANLAINQGRFEDARRDVKAVYRLSLLFGQNPMLIGRLIGVFDDKLASMACQNLATSGQLSSGQARQLIEDIQSLNPPSSMAEPIGEGERYLQLDAVGWISCGSESQDSNSTPLDRMRILENPLAPSSSPAGSSIAAAGDKVLSAVVDGATPMPEDPESRAWLMILGHAVPASEVIDALHLLNELYDQEVEIVESQTFRQLVQGNTEFRERLGKIGAQFEGITHMTRQQIQETPGRFGFFIVSYLTPSIGSAQVLAHLTRVNRDLAVVALALAAARADKSAYPQTLAELVPTYLKEIPKDYCSGQDFIYKPQGDGYLLYSVGENMRDDGGDAKLDIVVRANPR